MKEFDTTVLGGLPVRIEYDVTKVDGGLEYDWRISEVAGRFPTGGVEWIYRRLDKVKGSYTDMVNECHDHNLSGG